MIFQDGFIHKIQSKGKEMDTNYICEHKLMKESPELHSLFCNSVFCLQQMLNKYKNIFPTYTDHTALHSMEVIDFCNKLIGNNIEKMNADEMYVLLMAAYLHDSGMGISKSDYENFAKNINFGNYFDTHKDSSVPDVIREFHQEFSGEYIKKYAQFLEIPSEEHVFSIVQVSRGHRKIDLWDKKEYPDNYCTSEGTPICLPYLAALIRLADELDIAADRNLQFMYDIDTINNEFSKMEFKKNQAIRQLEIEEDAFVMIVDTSDECVYQGVVELKEKLNQTLQVCKEVVEKRTPYRITQSEIVIRPYTEGLIS